jgi:glycosyltransferase involved in cell wall biosynthesis
MLLEHGSAITIAMALSYVLVLAFAIQIYYLVFVFSKLAFYNPKRTGNTAEHSVSIVICAHNEVQNLKTLIPQLLEQKHSEFEIILMLDRCTDGTNKWLEKNNFTKTIWIEISETPNGWNSKKYALHQGIQQAKNDIILLTDADCRPHSSNWVTAMTQNINESLEACIGYSPYLRQNSLLNLIIRFETFYTAVQYFSWALCGKPYMGVGRNMAYSKKFFIQNKGMDDIKDINGGDDDLFANKSFTGTNNTIQIDADSLMWSVPKYSYQSYWKQKLRHLNAGKYYSANHKIRLGVYLLTLLIFIGVSTALLVVWSTPIPIFIMIILRSLILIYLFKRINCKLNENFKWYWIPFLEIIFIVNYFVIGFSTYFFNTKKWK